MGNYHGIWYLSKNFEAMYTTYIFLNKHATLLKVSER
mgnify:CR=1 FL=1